MTKSLVLGFTSLLFALPSASSERPDLQWLAGAWCSEDSGQSIEEHWLAERGGLMLGVNRTISRGRTSFEFVRIEIGPNGARYIAQPGGAPPVEFALVSASPREVVFANPGHDFPKRVRYARDGEALTARVDDGTDDGAAEEYRWTRCSAPSRPNLAD